MWFSAIVQRVWAPQSIIVLDPSIFELSDLMELLECHKLLLEIFRVELTEIVKSKYSVVLEFLLQKFSNLGRSQLSSFKCVSSILSCVILVFFMLYNFYSSFEETILLSSPNNFFLKNWLLLDDIQILINRLLKWLRQESDFFKFNRWTFTS